MNRDQLEAAVRREFTTLVGVCRRHGDITGAMNAGAGVILAAAESFALDEYGITADRRRALHDATAPTVIPPEVGAAQAAAAARLGLDAYPGDLVAAAERDGRGRTPR